MRILGGARLSAHFDAGNRRATAGAAGNSHAHALGHSMEMALLHRGIARDGELRGHYSILDSLDNVRGEEVAAVGNGGTEIGNLQRRRKYLALADGNGDYCIGAPVSLAIEAVVEAVVGNKAAALAGKVHAKFVAIAHAHKMVLPCLEGVRR